MSMSLAETEHRGVPGRPDDIDGEVMDELMATGAVVAGRGTVDPAGWWNGDHHDGVPIFILSRTKTEAEVARWPLVTVLDELQLHLVPVLLAAGRRLFEGIDPARHHEFELMRVREGRGVTHLRYRVIR